MTYKVVADFEAALCEYTGARYAVTTNSCSMALTLALRWHIEESGVIKPFVHVPRQTYASAPMALIHAGGVIEWEDYHWQGTYVFYPFPVWDSARRFTSGMYKKGHTKCVSFQTSKILGLEQGGAILHDNPKADEWLRRARFDGRLNAEEKLPKQIGFHCYLNPSTAALGLQRLAVLPKHNPDQCGYEAFPDLSELPIW